MAKTKRFCDDLNEILIWGSTRIAKTSDNSLIDWESECKERKWNMYSLPFEIWIELNWIELEQKQKSNNVTNQTIYWVTASSDNSRFF